MWAKNPDQHKILFVVDASQAEARIVARIATAVSGGTPCRLDEIFASGRKIHKVVASAIFKLPEDKIPKDNTPGSMYYIGKRTVHASNYDMGVQKFAIIIKKSVPETERLQKVYHAEFPEIKGKYHKWVKDELAKERTLTNTFGRPHTFLGFWDEELFRKGYSYYPQSSVGDLGKLCFKDLFYWFADHPSYGGEVLLNTHDGLVGQCWAEPEIIWDTTRYLAARFERPLDILGYKLIIPSESTIGRSFRRQFEFKTLDDIKRLLRKLRYVNAEIPGLHQSIHEIHGGSRISRGISLLDLPQLARGGGTEERMDGPGILQTVP